MNSDIAFFFNGSSIHKSGIDPNGFSIYPVSESYDALEDFQTIVEKTKQIISDEYEIIPHPTKEWGNDLFDMVAFICLK